MKEYERMIEKGLFTPQFLNPETRCDFNVTTEMKKIWLVELDLLDELIRVCRKHNLRYFLDGGTLLGAVRHRGFIPWDDDIDVSMLREDYDKLLALKDEFQHPYFLQTHETDPDCYYTQAMLRNSNTSCIHTNYLGMNMNMGISIDIFPLDNWQIEGGEERYERIKSLCIENSTYMRTKNPFLSEEEKIRVANWKGRDPETVYSEIMSLATEFKDQSTGYLCKAVNTQYSLKKRVMFAEDFSDVTQVSFEGLVFEAPIGYDRKLKIKYGNYMDFPPIEKRGVWHDNILLDAEMPYTEKLEAIFEKGAI